MTKNSIKNPCSDAFSTFKIILYKCYFWIHNLSKSKIPNTLQQLSVDSGRHTGKHIPAAAGCFSQSDFSD